MAVTKIKPIKSTLSKALDYIQNPDKTDGKTLVSSFGCSYETADIEFEYTLSQARQKGNNLAFHLIQSFEPGEVDCEKAHTIGKQLITYVPYAVVTALIGIVLMVVNKVDRTKNDMVMDMPFVYVGSQDVFMLSLCYRVGKLFSDCVGFLTVHLSRFKRLYQMKG